jgi:Trypsin
MRVNDVGILFLEQPVTLSVNIFPIFLPPLHSSSKPQPFLNEQGMVLGFAGSTTSGQEGLENMQAAYVRAMPHAACLQHYQNADVNQHFCAVDADFGSNFCLGDQVNDLKSSYETID